MAKNLLEGKLYRDKIQKPALTPEQIEAMHEAIISPETDQPLKNVPTESTKVVEKRDKPAKNSEKVITEHEVVAEAITRLSVDVTKEMHKLMKMRVIETEQSIRDYVVSLIKKDLGLK